MGACYFKPDLKEQAFGERVHQPRYALRAREHDQQRHGIHHCGVHLRGKSAIRPMGSAVRPIRADRRSSHLQLDREFLGAASVGTGFPLAAV
jgi:hypothetical protein